MLSHWTVIQLGFIACLLLLFIRERIQRAVLEQRLWSYIQFGTLTEGQKKPALQLRASRIAGDQAPVLAKQPIPTQSPEESSPQGGRVHSQTGFALLDDTESTEHDTRDTTAPSETESLPRERSAETPDLHISWRNLSSDTHIRPVSAPVSPSGITRELEWRQVAAKEALRRRRAERQSLRLYEEWLEFLAEHSDQQRARHWALERLRWGRQLGASGSFTWSTPEANLRASTSSSTTLNASADEQGIVVSEDEHADALLETSVENLSVLRDVDELERQSERKHLSFTPAFSREPTIARTSSWAQANDGHDADAGAEARANLAAHDAPGAGDNDYVASDTAAYGKDNNVMAQHVAEAPGSAQQPTGEARPGARAPLCQRELRSSRLSWRWQRIHESSAIPTGVLVRHLGPESTLDVARATSSTRVVGNPT